MTMEDHPTIKWFNEITETRAAESGPFETDYKKIKETAAEAGADDCGIADIYSLDLENEREGILALYPETKALICIVIKLNRENVQCVSRCVSDHEFIQGFDRTNVVARKLATLLRGSRHKCTSPFSRVSHGCLQMARQNVADFP